MDVRIFAFGSFMYIAAGLGVACRLGLRIPTAIGIIASFEMGENQLVEL